MPLAIADCKRRVCVSITAATQGEALVLAKESEPLAEVIEIRLDGMADPDPAFFVAMLNRPLLFTNRAAWEGGHCQNDEPSRLALLKKAAEAKAAFIDIELNTDPALTADLIATARNNGGRVIVSWHDFKTTASSRALQEVLERQSRTGADIGKIVTTARCFQDVFRVLALQETAADTGFPLIAFCMGQPGMISRVASPDLGGFMTYAAPDHGPATAPGQLPLSTLRRIFTELDHGR